MLKRQFRDNVIILCLGDDHMIYLFVRKQFPFKVGVYHFAGA